MSFKTMTADYWEAKKKIVPLKPEDEESVQGRIIIVTGANSGIGLSTTQELVKRGATVIMACRNLQKARDAVEEIRKKTFNGELIPMQIDLGDLASVRRFASEFKSKYPRLDILINNAGFAQKSSKLYKTVDGFETHMGVNHLGHFLLTLLLKDHLRRAESGRVVCVGSTIYHLARLDLDDINMVVNPPKDFGYGNYLPYANSKLANLMFVKELGRRLKADGIENVKVYGLCPGMVRSNFFRNDGWLRRNINNLVTMRLLGFSTEEACQTVLFCTLSRNIAQESGNLYRFGRSWPEVEGSLPQDKCEKLWEISEQLVGEKYSSLDQIHWTSKL